MKLDQPVFIFGSPRSGTTWLYHLLCCSGGFAIYRTESHAFHALGPRYGGFRTPALREEFLREWLPSEYFLRTGLEIEPFRTRFRENVRSAGDFLRLLMETIAEDQAATRWAECTPQCALYVREILAAWPKVRFLHIVRDGRDVALSLGRQRCIHSLPWHRDFGPMSAAIYWEWVNERALLSQELAPAQYLEVRFLDLVQNTEETLARIGAFIDHDLNWNRIQKFGFGSVSSPNTSFQTELQRGDFNPVGRWESGYTAAQLQRIESLIGTRLQAFGFELGTPREKRTASVADFLSRQIYRIRFSARTYFKSSLSFARRRIRADLLSSDWAENNDSDQTLRPGSHKDYVRAIVAQNENAFFATRTNRRGH